MSTPLPPRMPHPLDGWLASLDRESRESLGRRVRARARQYGLLVARPEGPFDIPTSLTPELVDPSALERRGRDAAYVLSGIVKTARAVLSEGVDTPRARALFGRFGPIERRGLENWRETETLTIARVDWFIDAAGRHRALELNATIPAMIGYSDAAARAWLETVGEEAGLEGDELRALVDQNGSNREEVRRSLVARARKLGVTSEVPSIAIIHREGDPQRPELESCVEHFVARGHRTRLATPAEVTVDEAGEARIGGEPFDVLYRHIFARRMEEGSPLARIAEGEARQRLQNPINGHLEVKGLLALLSRSISEEDAPERPALDDEERAALARVVPWTRPLTMAAAKDPDGASVTNLAHRIADDPDRFVLKRSWDYGGKSVSIGREIAAAEGPEEWRRRVFEAAGEEPGTWIVQERIDSPRRRLLVVDAEGAVGTREVFTDFSTYTATGPGDVPGGGVVRFAPGGIVNIAGGGGVAPLIRTDVAARLAERLETPRRPA